MDLNSLMDNNTDGADSLHSRKLVSNHESIHRLVFSAYIFIKLQYISGWKLFCVLFFTLIVIRYYPLLFSLKRNIGE